jgi:hypothetical protein
LSEVGKINDESILHLLEMVEKKQIGVGSINLVLRLIQSEQISNNHEISIQMQNLAKSENAYVRNLVNKHLNKIN